MAIDGSGDIVVENGSIRRVTGVDAIAQTIATRLRFVRGEWYQNRDLGTPYFEQIFADDSDDNVRRAVFERVVRETPGVKNVDAIAFDFDSASRSLFVDIRATSIDDESIVLNHVELQL